MSERGADVQVNEQSIDWFATNGFPGENRIARIVARAVAARAGRDGVTVGWGGRGRGRRWECRG